MVAMELTPKVFRDVQFREKARGGYHPEDVDEFLEQAALGAEVLTDRLREATERAERAEKSATESSATDDALKRMLLMGQRTVDQAITEAREEADQLLAAARAQASALVADAEERGRRAYEDSLADSRSRMEAASQSLRQAEQEVEALRGWVDVNRSHLLAVMRDAQGLIENAGLLSEPPHSTDLVATAGLPAPTEAAVGATSAPTVLATPASVGSPSAGPSPTGPSPAGPSPAPSPASPSPAGGEGEAFSLQEDNAPTGEWDARLLDEVAREASEAPPTAPDAADHQGEAGGANGQHSVQTASTAEEDEGLHTLPGDQTMAFDERALDSFFNDQDLGDDRGPGRFRRRQ